MDRSSNFQTIAWFNDLFQRGLLELDPPYQRRSVWNQTYKDYFIDTILLSYPAPAIFLYQTISAEGLVRYSVVDGKQRLTSVFEFLRGEWPLSERTTLTQLRGLRFSDLDLNTRAKFYKYTFSVEYLDTTDESIINNIFDRINRNVARLTRQELRHARFDGEFVKTVEDLTIWMAEQLPENFPNITRASRQQMKDVEITAQLLLLLETGTKSFSQDELDQAFSERDSSWERRDEIESRFRRAIDVLSRMNQVSNNLLSRTRLRNQADFYSLFGAIDELGIGPETNEQSLRDMSQAVVDFAQRVDSADVRVDEETVAEYFAAVRSASNDAVPRRTRLDILKLVLKPK